MIDSENAGTNGYNDLSCDDDYSFGDNKNYYNTSYKVNLC